MFTCFVTQAVCLLSLRALDASTIIRALLKMNALFPGVKKLFSDNGTNFKGADREMREAVKSWNALTDNPDLQAAGLEWIFGPARCGSAGGVWERLIAIAKDLLVSVMRGQQVDAYTFETYLFGQWPS